MEDWRDIPGLVGFYQASNEGRIRGVERFVRTKGGALRLNRSRVISPGSNGRYSFFKASIDGRLRTVLVHRAVCLAFNGEPPNPAMHAAHIDGDSANNVPANLRWATSKENCADRSRHGTQVRGTRVNTNKLSEADVIEIKRRAANGELPRLIALDYGIHRSSIHQMLRGDTWKHLNT